LFTINGAKSSLRCGEVIAMIDTAQFAAYRELLEDAAHQWGIAVTRDGKPGLWSGGLSTLEDIFAALGWDDPHMLTEPYTDPNLIGPDTYAVSSGGGVDE
jgi:hypothetical protein